MRSIPTITKNLLIINLLCFVAYFVLGKKGIDLNNILGLHFFMASDFHLYQFFTYMFMHASIEHIFFNMFALWMFGCVIERVLGPRRFLVYYIVCGLGAGVIQEASQYISFMVSDMSSYQFVATETARIAMGDYLNLWTTVGASGAIYGVLLAFGMIFPEERIFIFPLPVPIKAKWFVMFYIGIELYSALGTSSDGVAHFAHLGGMLFGFLLIRYWKKHPYAGGGYGRSGGQQFFDKLRRNWEQRSNKVADTPQKHEEPPRRESDMEYNAHKKKQQDEIDIILDKIRKSGYDSLTAEEKKKLFDQSNKNRT